MNFHGILTKLLLTVMAVGLVSATTELAAGPLKVNSAEPDNGVQGQEVQLVTIKGSGFLRAQSVRFLVTNTDDTGGVAATLINVIDDSTLTAEVSIADGATVALYDIEVQLYSGRKGKGTTLYSVRAKPNGNTSTFSLVDIEAAYYERTSDGDEIAEFDSPYIGGAEHEWTSDSGIRQQTFGESAYDFDHWEDNNLAEVPRLCEVTSIGNPPSAGRYDCFNGAGTGGWNHGGLVSIPLHDMVWQNVTVAKNGRPQDEPGFCVLLNDMSADDDYLEFGATRYSIHFSAGCPDVNGECPIEVGTLSYSGVSANQGDGQRLLLHPFHDLPGLPDIGRMPLTGYVAAEPDWSAQGELNVFTKSQDLLIGKFRISFYAVKNGALVATCETEPFEETVNIRIKTAPLP